MRLREARQALEAELADIASSIDSDVWDAPIETGETYPDRRKAKNAMHQELKKMREGGTYY